jgi:hypothetical protein
MRLPRSCFPVALATWVVLAAPAPAAGQTSAQKIEAARQLLEASQFDSATTILKQVIDQDPKARLEAYVWLGLVNHFARRDSLARAAFRQAFTLDPDLKVEGIAELDPKLPQVLAEARAEARGEPLPAPAAAAPVTAGAALAPPAGDDLPAGRCQPGCTGLERAPEFVSMPRVSFPDHLEAAALSLDLVVRAIVDTAGKVEPKSVAIVRSNVASMNADVMNALARARFLPGRVSGGPTRTLVELTFHAKRQGSTLILGPPEKL